LLVEVLAVTTVEEAARVVILVPLAHLSLQPRLILLLLEQEALAHQRRQDMVATEQILHLLVAL
jgi:hypothetical protein